MGDGDVVTAVATGGPVEVLMVGVIVETGHGACGTQGRIGAVVVSLVAIMAMVGGKHPTAW